MKKIIALLIICASNLNFSKDITIANLSHRQVSARLTYSDGTQSPIFNLQRFKPNQHDYAKRVNYADATNLDRLEIILNNAPFKTFNAANIESTGKPRELESCSAANGTLAIASTNERDIFNPFLICAPNSNSKFIENIA